MKCAIMELEAKQASNGNWYVNITAQPENDPFAEELHYRMWCSEALAEKLTANRPASIELRRVSVKVEQFQRVDDDGTIKPHLLILSYSYTPISILYLAQYAKRVINLVHYKKVNKVKAKPTPYK